MRAGAARILSELFKDCLQDVNDEVKVVCCWKSYFKSNFLADYKLNFPLSAV